MSKRLKGNLWIALAFFVAMGLGEQSPALGGFGILACVVYAVIFNRKFKKDTVPKNRESEDFELDENNHFKILSFEKNPREILVKLPGKPRREVYKVLSIAMDNHGQYLFNLLDEFNNHTELYYSEAASLITYDEKAYHTFDELILGMTNKSFFNKFDKLRNQYLQHLKNK